jgi:hypothetical protein
MKASDSFKIDQAWWKKNKPINLKTTGLGAVMKKYQDAKAKIQELAQEGKYTNEFNGPLTPFEAAEKILKKEIPDAVAKAKGMCNPAKLFKDTITVLDKYKNAISAERGLLVSMQLNFNRAYKKTHFDPMAKTATDIVKKLTQEKVDAQALYKETETAFKRIVQKLADINTLKKKNALGQDDINEATNDIKADVDKVTANCNTLVNMKNSAEEDNSAATRMNNRMPGVLSFRDQDVIRGHLNKITQLKNFILDYSTRSAMFKTGATSSVNQLKAAITDTQTKASRQLKELKALQTTMTGNEGSTRKLENAFTNILQQLPKMLKAVRDAPDVASIVIPAGTSVPVNKWKGQAQAWLTAADTALRKATKILAQSQDVKEKVFAKIDQGVLESEAAKPIVKDIEAKLGGIETYQKLCDADFKRFQQFQESLKTELGNK